MPPMTRQPNAAWSTQLQLLLESTGEGIYGIGTEGCCTFINRAAAEMLGRRPESMLGQNMHRLMHHTHADGRHYGEADCPIFQVQGLAKTYPGAREPVFDQVNFGIRRGEFVCLIGHSGCGKTTILNVLAGLEIASAGHVFMDQREVAGPSLERGVVFQGHALMPWLPVRKSIAFAVRSKWPDWSADKINEHVEKYLALVGLTTAIAEKPSALSGGMKQRVGIARAFAIEPKMLLLDEPFGALDALTRSTIQDELLRMRSETQQTVFMTRTTWTRRSCWPTRSCR